MYTDLENCPSMTRSSKRILRRLRIGPSTSESRLRLVLRRHDPILQRHDPNVIKARSKNSKQSKTSDNTQTPADVQVADSATQGRSRKPKSSNNARPPADVFDTDPAANAGIQFDHEATCNAMIDSTEADFSAS